MSEYSSDSGDSDESSYFDSIETSSDSEYNVISGPPPIKTNNQVINNNNQINNRRITDSYTPVGVWFFTFSLAQSRDNKKWFNYILLNGDKTFTISVINNGPCPYQLSEAVGVWEMTNDSEILLSAIQFSYDGNNTIHHFKTEMKFKLDSNATRAHCVGKSKTYDIQDSLALTPTPHFTRDFVGQGHKIYEPVIII